MRSLKTFASIAICIGFAGCVSNQWHADQVPLPRTTPFDTSAFARTAFLDGFRRGYRAQEGEGISSVDVLAGPNLEARRQGFLAGLAQARADKGEVASTQ